MATSRITMRHDTRRLLLAAAAATALASDFEIPPEEEFESIPGSDSVYWVAKDGRGDLTVQRGDSATVHVLAKVRDTGKVVMDTRKAGEVPHDQVFGVGGVIKGWDRAMLGTRVAERRIVLVPAHEGFGGEGSSALGIPSGADLELDLTVLQIRKNKSGKVRDESRGAPPPKDGERFEVFGEEPQWEDVEVPKPKAAAKKKRKARKTEL